MWEIMQFSQHPLQQQQQFPHNGVWTQHPLPKKKKKKKICNYPISIFRFCPKKEIEMPKAKKGKTIKSSCQTCVFWR